MQNLQVNATLQGGKYKIISTLGQGGFGITYLAEQTMLERKVAIKEFFMKELCERDESTIHVTLGTEGSRDTVNRFREKFLKEARNIAKLNHPNIVRIIDVFEENGTAYYVMEYCENGSLASKVKAQGCMSEPVATRYIIQVAEALDYIHQRKMNHLDVKPTNIMLNEKDDAVLIDFGLSKQYNAGGQQTSTTPVGISEGYAPMEQYKQGGVGEFSPETDIYALGATFFKLLTGVTPPSASDVYEDGVPVDELKAKGISQKAINVICKAMESRKRDRMKNVRDFIGGLQGAPVSVAENDDEATVLIPNNQRAEKKRKRKEAEVKVAKEKAEAEARTKANAKRKAKEEAERTTSEEEEQRKREAGAVARKKGNSTKIWIGIIVVAAIILGGIITISSYSQSASYSNGELNVNGVTYKMISVAGGTYAMGATSEMHMGDYDETPTHQVTVSGFSIGQTEVTQALWKEVMGNNPSCFKGDNLPVESVSWDDCMIVISKLNNLTGKNFRLPTEAEWEFAARGGNNSNHTRYSGSGNISDVAWHNDNSGDKTHPVAMKQANELGIYDMSGNVWEWCSDWYGDYSSSAQSNPIGASSGTSRVFRGGSWVFNAWNCRSSRRYNSYPDATDYGLGLRLCLSE